MFQSYLSTFMVERNLSAGALYRFKAYKVRANGDISEPETTPWFRTFESKWKDIFFFTRACKTLVRAPSTESENCLFAH